MVVNIKSTPTSSHLNHISYLQSPGYKLCHSDEPEIIPHLFSSCPSLTCFWENLFAKTGSQLQPPPHNSHSAFIKWLKDYSQRHKRTSAGIPMEILLSFSLWDIWNHRNSVIFNTNYCVNHSPATVLSLSTEFWYLAGDSHIKNILFTLLS